MNSPADNSILVDDMEAYNYSDNKIYDTWKDDCGDSNGISNGTRSCVSPVTEPVNGGIQFMVFYYNNDGFFGSEYYSETARIYSDLCD